MLKTELIIGFIIISLWAIYMIFVVHRYYCKHQWGPTVYRFDSDQWEYSERQCYKCNTIQKKYVGWYGGH
jgi:hypothetical protein